MSSVTIYVILALSLAWLAAEPCLGQEDIKSPKYVTVANCEEVCRLHPETECRLDCIEGTQEGKYKECLNRFYYSNGAIESHCDWD